MVLSTVTDLQNKMMTQTLHLPSVCTLMAEAVMSVVILKYGIQRSCNNRLHQVKVCRVFIYSNWHSCALICNPHSSSVILRIQLTSICLLLKTLLMLELKAAPENIEVIGYVKSRTFLNTEVISYRGKVRRKKSSSFSSYTSKRCFPQAQTRFFF